MTLADLLTALYGDLGYAASPDAAVTTRLTRFLNDGYQSLLRIPGYAPLRFKTISMASVAAQKLYGISPGAVRVLGMSDQTNNQPVLEMSLGTFRRVDPQELVTGVPTHRIPMGFQPVARQPATSGVWVVSSTADTATVRLVGQTSTGETAVQTATINGTTRVQVGSLATLVGIESWSISAAAAGAVSLYDASSAGNLLATIPIGQTSVQYLSIRLWPTPSDAYTYAVDVETTMPQLTNATDVPVVPTDFHPMLVEYGRMREYEYRADERYPVAFNAFQANLKALTVRLWNTPDYLPVAGSSPNTPNNLGPWYPTGRW
jgi:hypothetical protein